MRSCARLRGLGGLTAGLAAVVLVAVPAAAHTPRAGRPGDLGVPGMGERQLREFETAVLGPEHAMEHARLRAEIRRQGRDAPQRRAATAAAAPSVPPSIGGRWEAPFPIPVIGINAVVLPTGKVMWFAYPVLANPKYGVPNAPNTAQAWLWNPADGAVKRIDPPLWRDPKDGKLKPANIWCGAQTLTADGRVVVAGGNLAYKQPGGNYKGLNKVYTFDPWNETWTEQPEMEDGRWYPSEVRLPDGRILIIGGLDSSGAPQSTNQAIDLFRPSGDLDGRGTITTLGHRGGPGEPPDGGLYPHLFWMPSGRMMVAGPDPADSWFLHDPTEQNLFGWDDIQPASRRRVWASAVLLPGGTAGSTKVELIGGGSPIEDPPNPPTNGQSTNTTELFDESAPATSAWQPAAPLNIGRGHLNTVQLPDSSMVTVGGGIGTVGDNMWAVDANGDQRQVELYDPQTNTWRLGAAQAEARAYHSTAVLLPDARVVSAGDDYNGPGGPGTGIDKDTAEIYEPPYLFNANGTPAARPRISSAPAAIRYDQPSFHVATPDHDVTSAALVAPGATTHANDMNQRVVPLGLSSAADGVDLAPPPSAGIAPPGYYMLFLLNDKGVPSVARWVLLGRDPPPAGRIEIAQRTEPRDDSASKARFTFYGPPFDGVALADGQTESASVPSGPSETVPGGHYTVTQAKAPGYDAVSVECNDPESSTSVATRSARVNLAAGETVRCTYTARRRPGGAPPQRSPQSGRPTPHGGPARRRDRRGPRLSFSGRTGLNPRHGILAGRVSDGSGVERVEVALAARRGRYCRWWSRSDRRFALRRASCRRPVYMRARLRRRGSGFVWRLSLHRRLRRGRYVVALRAVDESGNVTTRSGRSAVRVTVRR